MNIELRNVQYNARMSEETACFSATVYLDGKRAGTVCNRGTGGADEFEPFELEQRLNAYGATLPDESDTIGGETYTSKPNAETLIGKALDEFLLRRDLQRGLADRILWIRDGKVFQSKSYPKARVAREVERLRGMPSEQALGQFRAEYILNLCTFDEALRIYRAALT